MKSYHDPRAACALPFSLSRRAFAKRMKRVERSMGRLVVVTRVTTTDAWPTPRACDKEVDWRKKPSPRRLNWYDHAATKYGVARYQIKMLTHAYGYRASAASAALWARVDERVVVQLFSDLDDQRARFDEIALSRCTGRSAP